MPPPHTVPSFGSAANNRAYPLSWAFGSDADASSYPDRFSVRDSRLKRYSPVTTLVPYSIETKKQRLVTVLTIQRITAEIRIL